jgi:hypothetical protein
MSLLVFYAEILMSIFQVDKSALFLIGAVAGPIAQHLVDQSELKFSEANITFV